MVEHFSYEVVVAMFWVMKSLKNKPLVIEEISEILHRLTVEHQIETGASLRKVVSGFWSADASQFSGKFELAGLSKDSKLNKEGLKFAVEGLITDEALRNPTVFGEVSKIIGFKLPNDFFEKLEERP